MSKHLIVATAAFVTASSAASALAQTTERDLLGWTPGNEVVVHVVERGERMVDGVSKDYFVEATEVWNASGASTLYQHGEAVGPAPAWYGNARSATAGKPFRDALKPDHAAAANKPGTHRFAWYSRSRIDRPNKRDFVCVLQYRVVLLAQPTQRGYTVVEDEAKGEPSRRQDEADCPSLDVDPHWSPDDNLGFALVRVGREVKPAFAPVTELDSLPWGAFTPSPPLAAQLAEGAEAEAWRALDVGDFDTARKKFDAAKAPVGVALVHALDGHKRAIKKAEDGYRASQKTTRDQMFRAAAYIAAGEGKQATKWIDAAVKTAQSYEELLGFASIFEPVDPNVANQLAVHALSHPTAENADTTAGWTLLAEGLLDLGEYSKAEEALGKIEKQTPASLAAHAVLHLDRQKPRLARKFAEDMLFQNPGDCRGYLITGRMRSFAGDTVDARALFEAALACDPGLEEAAFYAADFARLAGDLAQAKKAFDHYLRVAPPRGSDQIRGLRRATAMRWSERLGNSGVVLADVSCRRGGAGYLCTGTLKNTADSASGKVDIEVKVKGRKVGSAQVADIGAGETAPFGVSFEAKSLGDAVVSAGRNAKERRANETPAK